MFTYLLRSLKRLSEENEKTRQDSLALHSQTSSSLARYSRETGRTSSVTSLSSTLLSSVASLSSSVAALSSSVASLSSVASSSSSEASGSSGGLGVGHVDSDSSAVKVLVVEASDGGVGLGLGSVGLQDMKRTKANRRDRGEQTLERSDSLSFLASTQTIDANERATRETTTRKEEKRKGDERRSRNLGTCRSLGPS